MDFLPTHVRAYIFVLIAFGCALIYISFIYSQKTILKWFVLWSLLTSVAFLSGNIWIVITTTAIVCLRLSSKKPEEKIYYYFLLLPVLPFLNYEIPGLIPGIRFLFEMTHPRMLSLFILLPIFLFFVRKDRHSDPQFRVNGRLLNGSIDKLVVLYSILLCILTYRNPTFTSSLRSIFYIFTDIFVPYYVISRYVRSFDDFHKILFMILFTGIMLSFVGLFEEALRWKFYNRLPAALDLPTYGVARYDKRGGILRITATMSHPIPFGYFLVLVLGAFFFIKSFVQQQKIVSLLTLSLLSTALFFTISRGAWIAGIVLVILYFYLNIEKRAYRQLLTMLGMLAFFLLFVGLPSGSEINAVDEYGTFDYRVKLVQEAIPVIQNNFFLGTADFNEGEAMESMRQGQGIIDVVNTYLQVAFHSGMVGLTLFLLIFLTLLSQLRKAVKKVGVSSIDEVWILGNTLVAMVVATIVMLATTSSINFIPVYYWALIALGCAYIRMINAREAESTLVSKVRFQRH